MSYDFYDKTLVVRIPNSTYIKLQDSKKYYQTVSDAVREAIEMYLSVKNS